VRRRLALSEAQFADPSTRVPLVQLAQLLGVAVEHSKQRDIGLLAARWVERVHFGLMEDVTRTKATLRSALETGIRYAPLLGDGVHYDFELSGELATSRLWFDPEIQMHEAAMEFVLAIGLLWARRMTGIEQLAPLEVHFTHARPADISRHEKLFRCKLFFSAPVAKVVMSARFLDRSLAGSEPVLAQLLQQRAEVLLQALPRTREATIASQVRKSLLTRPDLHAASAETIARRLGLGVRTMARRLEQEQTSYREVLDDVRRQAALQALARSERSIAEIADALGFASPQSFQRAVRRWTGLTAAAYRRKNTH
jgi:AraC-like DNA-binding protein